MINDFNINKENMNASLRLRMNEFSDLSMVEFRYYIHGHQGSCFNLSHSPTIDISSTKHSLSNVPSIDWTDINGRSYVTPVKNQGSCGSCWAFSATACTESQYAIKHNISDNITVLSEQQLIDCSKGNGNNGCSGGSMQAAFKYIKNNSGLCSEGEYPYLGKDGQICKANACQKYYPISGYISVSRESVNGLENAVLHGPISAAIEADDKAFQFYSSGILDGKCGTKLDHGILVVGYGSLYGSKYWKIKNSWGSSWGMDGYVLVCKECNKNGNKGECGVLMQPLYDIVL